jgi:hypothetical protein
MAYQIINNGKSAHGGNEKHQQWHQWQRQWREIMAAQNNGAAKYRSINKRQRQSENKHRRKRNGEEKWRNEEMASAKAISWQHGESSMAWHRENNGNKK